MDGDYDSSWVVAVYSSEELAKAHIEALGGSITEDDVRSGLHPDVTNADILAKLAQEQAEARRQHEEYQRHQQVADQQRQAMRPDGRENLQLCSCSVFTSETTKGWFITPHGYCGYCGKWTPDVVRQLKGETYLQREIDKLNDWNRDKMREIVRQPLTPGAKHDT